MPNDTITIDTIPDRVRQADFEDETIPARDSEVIINIDTTPNSYIILNDNITNCIITQNNTDDHEYCYW